LYKPSDTRMADGGELVLGKHWMGHSAFHLLNFFDSVALLRNKYNTRLRYTHGYRGCERLILWVRDLRTWRYGSSSAVHDRQKIWSFTHGEGRKRVWVSNWRYQHPTRTPCAYGVFDGTHPKRPWKSRER
jgi:hypothetical protein